MLTTFHDVKINPKQMILLQSLLRDDVEVIGFGGAKKGGKSWISRFALVLLCQMFPGCDVLLLRRTFSDVKKNHLGELRKLCRKYKIRYKYNVVDNCFLFLDWVKDGEPSKLWLGYAEDIKDAERYQGINWLAILLDEATQFPEELVSMIVGELSNALYPGFTPKALFCSNPIGIGKRWMRRDVVDAKTRRPRTVWIKARWQDNIPFAQTDPGFAERLKRTHRGRPWLIAALLGGSWDADPDRFYDFDHEDGGRHVKRLIVPYWAKWYAGVDYGYKDSDFVCLWAARWRDRVPDDKGRFAEHFHFVDELVLREEHMDAQAKASLAHERILRRREKMPPRLLRYADNATGKELESESDETPRTVAIVWDKHGFITCPARKYAKVTRKTVVRYLLHHEVMSLDPRCLRYIEELRDAVHERRSDGSLGSSTDPKQADDAQDAGEYMTTEVFGIEYAASPEDCWDELLEEAA